MGLTKLRQGVVESVPASTLTGTSLPTGLGIGTRLDSVDMTSTTTITGIPSTAKMLMIGVSNLSSNDNSANYGLQLGTSGGLTTSGYQSNHWYIYDSSNDNQSASTTSISLGGWGASSSHEVICTCYNVTGNIWQYVMTSQVDGGYAGGMSVVGGVTLGGTLDRIGWTATAGAFDSGTMSVTYY